ncbi:MAG: hypothetical protein FWD11_09985, partial [Micrococcales bacterium]|nr:hypothetical protein [Micrococcales bacterium]
MSAPPDVPADYPSALAQAVLRLYSDARLSQNRLQAKALGATSYPYSTRPVADGLSVGLAIDVGPTYTRVSDDMLARWQVDFARMFEETCQRQVFGRTSGSLRLDDLSVVRDELVIPALFVHPPLAMAWTEPRRPVVLPLHASMCLVAPEGDTAAIERMAAFASSALSDDNTMVETIVPQWWDGQRWWPMTWAQLGCSPQQDSLFHAKWAAPVYDTQRDLLQQLYDRTG